VGAITRASHGLMLVSPLLIPITSKRAAALQSRSAMGTSVAPVLRDSVVSQSYTPRTDTRISEPAETSRLVAALVDALFSEDGARCRELLDVYPELVNTPLKHQVRT
jgi:hypothetical protein